MWSISTMEIEQSLRVCLDDYLNFCGVETRIPKCIQWIGSPGGKEGPFPIAYGPDRRGREGSLVPAP